LEARPKLESLLPSELFPGSVEQFQVDRKLVVAERMEAAAASGYFISGWTTKKIGGSTHYCTGQRNMSTSI